MAVKKSVGNKKEDVQAKKLRDVFFEEGDKALYKIVPLKPNGLIEVYDPPWDNPVVRFKAKDLLISLSLEPDGERDYRFVHLSVNGSLKEKLPVSGVDSIKKILRGLDLGQWLVVP